MIRSFAAVVFVMSATIAASSPALAQTTHNVTLDGIIFIPDDITIRAGDTVRWEWVSGFHNVESGTIDGNGNGIHDGNFRSGDATGAVGTTFDLTFDEAFLAARPMAGGEYPYSCIVHASVDMAGIVRVVECVTDNDCNDGNACTDDSCTGGTCVQTNNIAACDDGQFCTATDVCAGGACVGSGNPCGGDFCNEAADRCDECASDGDCDDGVGCTLDQCVTGTCLFSADDGLCPDDGTFCNGAERCDAAAGCVSAGDPCDPSQFCNDTDGRCDACVEDSHCDDGSECTAGQCEDGACNHIPIAGCTNCEIDADCEDGDPCTDDTCSAGVCASSQSTSACDDDDPCTTDDRCAGGTCAGTAVPNCCQLDEDCDDGNACTQDACVDETCSHVDLEDCTPCESAEDCEDGDVCMDHACEEGVCAFVANSAPCDDLDPCTTEDLCSEGACIGTPLEECCDEDDECDDADPCTQDACANHACLHEPLDDCDETDNDDLDEGEPDDGDPEDDDGMDGAPGGDDPVEQPVPSSRGACGLFGLIGLPTLLLGLIATRFTSRRRGRAGSIGGRN